MKKNYIGMALIIAALSINGHTHGTAVSNNPAPTTNNDPLPVLTNCLSTQGITAKHLNAFKEIGTSPDPKAKLEEFTAQHPELDLANNSPKVSGCMASIEQNYPTLSDEAKDALMLNAINQLSA